MYVCYRYCYDAAACNAANRVPVQIMNDAYSTVLKEPSTILSDLSLTEFGSACNEKDKSDFSFIRDQKSSPISKSRKLKTMTPMLKKQIEDMKWREYRDTIASRLSYQSPAKFTNGLSANIFDAQLKKAISVKEKGIRAVASAEGYISPPPSISTGAEAGYMDSFTNQSLLLDKPDAMANKTTKGVDLEASVEDAVHLTSAPWVAPKVQRSLGGIVLAAFHKSR